MTSAPGFSLQWSATKADVSAAGDLGYTAGAYQMTMNDAAGKPMRKIRHHLEEAIERDVESNGGHLQRRCATTSTCSSRGTKIQEGRACEVNIEEARAEETRLVG